MLQWIEAVVGVAALLSGLFAFVHGLTLADDPAASHLWAITGLCIYAAVWTYGIMRAAYS